MAHFGISKFISTPSSKFGNKLHIKADNATAEEVKDDLFKLGSKYYDLLNVHQVTVEHVGKTTLKLAKLKSDRKYDRQSSKIVRSELKLAKKRLSKFDEQCALLEDSLETSLEINESLRIKLEHVQSKLDAANTLIKQQTVKITTLVSK